MTQFDAIITAFANKLSAATAVSAHVETDGDAEPLPVGRTDSILITLADATPQPLGQLQGNPVDWVTTVMVHCFASVQGASARAAANTLAGAAYARLATDPSLGVAGVFIGEPTIRFETDQTATRTARATLTYSVQHRTSSLTLD